MKILILPIIVLAAAVAAFVFWPEKTSPPCISDGKPTSLPWLECKK